jgi:hypothetical protein
MKKDKRKLMEEASEAWVMENPETRTFFSVIGDKETNTTSCGVHGREDLIAGAIANEMLNDRDIADVIMTSVKVYNAVLEEEQEGKEKVKKETTKIYS